MNNAKNKKFFLILPKESPSELDLFEAFYSTISKQLENNTLVRCLLKNSEVAREYKEQIYDGDNVDVDKADLKQAIKEIIKKEEDLIIECFIKLNNTEFFSKIKKSYQTDTKEICFELREILKSLEPVLKEFEIDGKLCNFSKIIVAAHLGGRRRDTYMLIQHTINMYLSQQDDEMKKLKFVYFSAAHDEPDCNEFIRNHKTFSKYSYDKLIEEKSEEQFKYFLKLLEARADEEEIKHFKTVVTKKYINKLIEIFWQTAIDCNGIQQLNIMNKDTTQYEKAAFEGLDLKEYLKKIWLNENGESKLFNLAGLSDEKAKKLRPIICDLRNAAGPEEFTYKFKKFTDAASSIKKSLNLSYNKT
jgi:hypothetical protein